MPPSNSKYDMRNVRNSAPPWWIQEGTAAKNLWGLIQGLSQMQASRHTSYLRYVGMYADADLWSLMQASSFGSRPYENRFNRLTLNVTRSIIDTLVSKMAVSQPRVEILTEGGNWEQQMRGKNTTRFLAGVFEETKLYRLAPLACRDAGIFGDGYIKWYVADGKICIERTMTPQWFFDEAEAINGKPRQAFQVYYVAREQLLVRYPDKADIIQSCSADDLITQVGINYADMCKVVEAWHLPSSDGGDDGKHTLALSNGTLVFENWDYDTFPFVRVRWRPAVGGWYSQGLADELMGLQVEINRIAKRIGLGIHLMAVPRILVETGSKVVTEHLSNQVASIVKYLGTKPEVQSAQVFTPEVYSYLENLYNKAYALAGISPLESRAQKPAGLDSEPALREYADLASERHAYFSMEWDEFFKDCAWQALRCARELKEQDIDVEAQNDGKSFLDVVKFSDCLFDDDNFTFKIATANLLPTTAAGKLNRVNDMAQSGILDPNQALKLLDFPDIQSAIGELTAQRAYVEKILYKMLSDGETVEVEATNLNLGDAIKQVNDAYLQAITDDAPEERLALVRQWLKDARTAAMPPPPPPAPPAGPPGMPGGPGGMPPSNLQPQPGIPTGMPPQM